MIALLIALQAAPPLPSPSVLPPSSLGAIGRQALPATGCAAYLWSTAGDRTLVAMAVANPAHIRVAIDGAPPGDLPLVAAGGLPTLGFGQTNTYQAGDVTATLDMTVAPRADLNAGALVSQGTLTIARPGRDATVLPVAGLVGCAS